MSILKIINKSNKYDVKSFGSDKGWFYSKTVKSHFLRPRNFWKKTDEKIKWNGMGIIGSPACGDVMRVWLYIEPKTEKIKKFKWQTFGCASAIASTSMLSIMVTEKGGMILDKALQVKPQDIMDRLGGLPERKIHCSVLGDKALRAAINDYFRRTKQYDPAFLSKRAGYDRIKSESAKIIDKILNITDKDIEEAVKSGAKTLKKVQEITKVGLGDKNCVTEAEQLIRFYAEKYYK